MLRMNESIHGEETASELQDRVKELIEQQTAISEVQSRQRMAELRIHIPGHCFAA
jgi:hypothetical protein